MTIADAPVEAGPLATRLATSAHRLIVDLELPAADLPWAIAARTLADDEIRAGLAAAPLVVELDRRHRWRSWGDGSAARTCTCGRGDCDVRDLLDRARG